MVVKQFLFETLAGCLVFNDRCCNVEVYEWRQALKRGAPITHITCLIIWQGEKMGQNTYKVIQRTIPRIPPFQNDFWFDIEKQLFLQSDLGLNHICQGVCCCQDCAPISVFHLGSISPTFYVQLLRLQIPKVQKRHSTQAAFWVLGSAGVKAACKHFDEIDLRSFSVEVQDDWYSCKITSNIEYA